MTEAELSAEPTEAELSAEPTKTNSSKRPGTRRRAVRPAGPTAGKEGGKAGEITAVRLEKTPAQTRPASRSRGGSKTRGAGRSRAAGKQRRPPRRPANRRLVVKVAAAFGLIVAAVIGTGVAVMLTQQISADKAQQRSQRFVDTASQLAVNMYSFNQNTVEDSVRRVIESTTGPLHDMLGAPGHPEILQQFFRSMGGSAEAVVTGAALENIECLDAKSDVCDASVLVSVRVTTADMDGNNQPSTPSRMRITVREADGRMAGYDLKWPDGGN